MFPGAPEHQRARAWLQHELTATSGGVALCWPVLYSMLRLITNSRAFGAAALTVAQGWAGVSQLLAQPAVRVISAGARHSVIAEELARTPGLRSDDVPDLEIAALAIEHGLTLATRDHGFRRFARLGIVDPLT